jgi:FixJ family two-component response regulator
MKRRKSNPYRVLMRVAHDLEMEGIDGHTITDALFVAAVHGAIVIVGHKEVAASLREMASMVEGKGVDTPQTTH